MKSVIARSLVHSGIIFISVLAIFITWIPTQAHATVTVTEFPICTTAAYQYSPAISGDTVVWDDNRNGNWDIYGYDLSTHTEFAICTDVGGQFYPAISGDTVVWHDYRNGNYDIYGYDLSTHTEFALCTAAGNQWYPAISGDTVVWDDNRNGNPDIYGYDLSTHSEFAICTAAGSQYMPAISGDTVVWYDYRNGNSDIYGYDLSTHSEFSICTAAGIQDLPAISGDTVVWHDYRNGNYDIYGYDLSTHSEFPICTAAGGQDYPAISGDTVVWDNYIANIYGYDLSTHSEFAICTAAGNQWYPAISGDTVVWDNYIANIYGYDLSTHSEFAICTAAGNQWYPAISGDTVVWMDGRNGNSDIYGATIDYGTPPPPPTISAGSEFVVTTAHAGHSDQAIPAGVLREEESAVYLAAALDNVDEHLVEPGTDFVPPEQPAVYSSQYARVGLAATGDGTTDPFLERTLTTACEGSFVVNSVDPANMVHVTATLTIDGRAEGIGDSKFIDNPGYTLKSLYRTIGAIYWPNATAKDLLGEVAKIQFENMTGMEILPYMGGPWYLWLDSAITNEVLDYVDEMYESEFVAVFGGEMEIANIYSSPLSETPSNVIIAPPQGGYLLPFKGPWGYYTKEEQVTDSDGFYVLPNTPVDYYLTLGTAARAIGHARALSMIDGCTITFSLDNGDSYQEQMAFPNWMERPPLVPKDADVNWGFDLVGDVHASTGLYGGGGEEILLPIEGEEFILIQEHSPAAYFATVPLPTNVETLSFSLDLLLSDLLQESGSKMLLIELAWGDEARELALIDFSEYDYEVLPSGGTFNYQTGFETFEFDVTEAAGHNATLGVFLLGLGEDDKRAGVAMDQMMITASPVPEPWTVAMIVPALLGFAGMAVRRRK